MGNPFKPTAGAEPPYLIGREHSLDLFTEGLEDGAGAPGLLNIISGPRGIGKTALLHRTEQAALAQGWIAVSDTATPGLLGRIGRMVDNHLAKLGEGRVHRSVTGFQAGGFGITTQLAPEEQAGLRKHITVLVRMLDGHGTGLLLTVDEIHSVDRAELAQLAAIVQHLVRDSLPIALVVAGIPKAVSDLLNDDVATFLRRADPIILADVPVAAVKDSMRETFGGTGVFIGEDHLQAAAEATGGYPFLIQLVGYHVWRLSKESGVTDDTLLRGVEAARRRLGSMVLATTLADLSEVDRTFLLKMAADDGPSAIADIAARMGQSTKYAGVYRKRLMDAGVIRPAGRGRVRFAVPHLAEYLRNHAAQLHEPGLA